MNVNSPGSAAGVAASLDDLVIRETDLEDCELATSLRGKVGLIEGMDKIKLLGSLLQNNTKQRLIAAGLARHAMRRKGWIDDQSLSASTEWFAVQVQQKPKSVGEELSRLKKAGLFERQEGGWLVPRWALRQAIEFLGE